MVQKIQTWRRCEQRRNGVETLDQSIAGQNDPHTARINGFLFVLTFYITTMTVDFIDKWSWKISVNCLDPPPPSVGTTLIFGKSICESPTAVSGRTWSQGGQNRDMLKLKQLYLSDKKSFWKSVKSSGKPNESTLRWIKSYFPDAVSRPVNLPSS